MTYRKRILLANVSEKPESRFSFSGSSGSQGTDTHWVQVSLYPSVQLHPCIGVVPQGSNVVSDKSGFIDSELPGHFSVATVWTKVFQLTVLGHMLNPGVHHQGRGDEILWLATAQLHSRLYCWRQNQDHPNPKNWEWGQGVFQKKIWCYNQEKRELFAGSNEQKVSPVVVLTDAIFLLTHFCGPCSHANQ